jgi:hypothetical protein
MMSEIRKRQWSVGKKKCDDLAITAEKPGRTGLFW